MPKQNKCISQNVFLLHNCIHGTKYRDVYLVQRNHLSVIHRPNVLGVLSPPYQNIVFLKYASRSENGGGLALERIRIQNISWNFIYKLQGRKKLLVSAD